VKSLPLGWVRAMQDAICENQESNKQGKRSKTKWITKYKKQHKDVATKSVKKKYRMTKKPYSSSFYFLFSKFILEDKDVFKRG
jgi:hypothetical protein